MGKGDIKSRRGKISNRSYGKLRKKRKATLQIVNQEVKTKKEEPKAAGQVKTKPEKSLANKTDETILEKPKAARKRVAKKE
jgi:ribosomal small subunit protein bTHX